MKVPTYESPQVQPAKGAVPNLAGSPAQPYLKVRADADTFGAGVAEATARGAGNIAGAVSHVSAQAAELARKARAEANDIARTQARGTYQDMVDREQRDLANYRGQAAFAETGNVYERLAKSREEIKKSLANDEVRQLVDLDFDTIDRGNRNVVETHVRREWSRADDESFARDDTSTLRSLATNAQSAPEVQSGFFSMREESIREYAKRRGLDAGAEAQLVTDFRRRAHQVVLNQLESLGDTKGLRTYFSTVKEELGELGAKYQGRITALTEAESSEREAAVIMSESRPDPAYPWADPELALSKVGEVDEALRPKVRQLVEHQLDIAERLRKRAGEQKLAEAFGILEQTGTLESKQMQPVKNWLLDPKNGAGDLWHKLEAEYRSEVRANRIARTGSRAALSAEEKARRELARQRLEEFKALPDEDQVRLDVDAEYVGDVDPRTRAVMKQVQKKTGARLERGDLVSDRHFTDSVTAFAAQNGITDAKKVVKLKAYMTDWRNQQKDGVRQEDLDKALQEATTKVVIERPILWDKETTRFEAGMRAPPPDGAPASVKSAGPKLSKKDRAVQLKREGKSVSDIARTLTSEGY